MGLDMYLSRRSYVKNWEWRGPEEQHEITIKKGGVIRTDIQPARITYIIEQVAYWRKANAIHRWFVEVCQGGVDECQETEVSVEQLKQLVELCKRVLATVETVEGDVKEGTTYFPDGRVEQHTRRGHVVAQQAIADDLLPTQSGFFFGGTDYDDYYLEDLRNTVTMLEPLLELDGEFLYQASW